MFSPILAPFNHAANAPWANFFAFVTADYLDDMYSFNPANKTWTLLSGSSRPSARRTHGFISAGGKLYVYGGQGRSGELSGVMVRGGVSMARDDPGTR